MIVFDTDVLTRLIRAEAQVVAKAALLDPNDIGVPIIPLKRSFEAGSA